MIIVLPIIWFTVNLFVSTLIYAKPLFANSGGRSPA